jgi:hypothetical protein
MLLMNVQRLVITCLEQQNLDKMGKDPNHTAAANSVPNPQYDNSLGKVK